MRIPSGKTDIYAYFVAFATADGSRMTGLSSFTVARSRNGAADVAYTTPTVTEVDATTMPGVYALLIDEDTTIASTSDSEEYCVHITATGMEPVTRTIELYRRDTTSGETLTVASGNGNAAVQSIAANAITAASIATGAIDADAIADSAIDAGAIASGAITSAKFANGAITASVLADDAITAAKLSAGAESTIAAAVWVSTPRTLTALDEDSTTLDLDATIRGAIGMAAADLDTQIDTLATAAALATVDTVVDAIQAKTDNLPLDPADASDIATATNAILSDTNAILVDTGTTLPAQIAALNDLSAAEVNAEVVDALNTDTYAEPGQGAPGATISLAAKIGYLYKAWRNRKTQTASEFALYADDAVTVDQKSTVSDDGTTATRGEIVTGP